MSGLKLETITLRTPNQQIIANYDDIQTNRELIDLHYETDRIIAELGIHIIGTVASFEEIKNTIPTAWGDAYAVGEPENYKFYIWTRRSPTIPLEEGEWLNLGKIAIQGPMGPAPVIENNGTYITATNPHTGLTTNIVSLASLKGNRGATWKAGPGAPTAFASDVEGDLYLNTITSDVYRFQGGRWVPLTNIRGGQGNIGKTGPAPMIGNNGSYIIAIDPQTGVTTNVVSLAQLKGEKGQTGDVGGLVNIAGIVPNKGALPTPPSVLNNTSIAYLVGTAEPYELYIQVGETPATAQWQPMGPLNVATLVTVGGSYQNIWDADTKLDKNTAWDSKTTAYVKYPTGSQGNKEITSAAIAGTIPERNSSGEVLVGANPTSTNAATPKTYVDNIAVVKQSVGDASGTEQKLYLYAKPDKSDSAKKIIAPGSIRILSNDNNYSVDFTPSQIVAGAGGNFSFIDLPTQSGKLATLNDLKEAKFLRREIAANGNTGLLPNSLYMISASGNNVSIVDGSTTLVSNSQFMIVFCAEVGSAGPGKFAVMGMTYNGGLNINTFTVVATRGTTKLKNSSSSSTAGYNIITKETV